MQPIYVNNWYWMYTGDVPWYYYVDYDYNNPKSFWLAPTPNRLMQYNGDNARRRIDNSWRWTYTGIVDNWWGVWTVPWTAAYAPWRWYAVYEDRSWDMYPMWQTINTTQRATRVPYGSKMYVYTNDWRGNLSVTNAKTVRDNAHKTKIKNNASTIRQSVKKAKATNAKKAK